jgi:hypothetical protein
VIIYWFNEEDKESFVMQLHTCSTIFAIRIREGKPSGVDTIEVPALITTRRAFGMSLRPRIIDFVVALLAIQWGDVRRTITCWLLIVEAACCIL